MLKAFGGREFMLITPFYAAIFALVFFALSIRTIVMRRRFSVGIGDGDEPVLARAVRAQGNFAEYVPFALLLVFFLEYQTRASTTVHILCLVLLIGRLLHAYGVSQPNENYRFRVTGMALTFTVLLAGAVRLLWAYI